MTDTLDPRHFAPAPARDRRFVVKEFWRDMENDPEDHDLEFLHRQMNEEINSLEMAARNLADFPNADWELRLAIARQCWDESRHAVAFRTLFEKRGGRVGQFPVLNFQYRIIMNIPSLIARLAVANRSFEASGMDAIQDGIESSRRKQDSEFVTLFDAQLADELQHVRFANEWLKKLMARDGPRAVIELARGVAEADEAFKLVAGDSGVSYPVAEALRREAGFSEEEIAAARAMVDK